MSRPGGWDRRLYETSPIALAEREIENSYGDTVSCFEKGKSLVKFGRSTNADSGQKDTVAQWQGATQYEETFVFDNLIDEVSSSSSSDTQSIKIEGHTVNTSTGDYTFVVQTVTLTGQTPVTLPTPLARCSRLVINSTGTLGDEPAGFVGNIHVYDSSATTVTAGVPQTATATKMYVPAGQTQSQKCQTTISSQDYYLITEVECSITSSGPATKANFDVEIRKASDGGPWRPIGAEISLDSTNSNNFDIAYLPYLIVPKNHDIRIVVTTTGTNSEVSAEFEGYLAKVI